MATILGDPEALAADVGRRARQRAVEIAEEARRRSAAILEDAKNQAEALRKDNEQATERRAAALVRRNAARAELEGRRRFLEFREAPIERVWRSAEQRLRELVQQPAYLPAYLDVLKRCAFRAAGDLGASELILAADTMGHKLLSDEVLAQWSNEAQVQFHGASQPIQFHRASQPHGEWGGLLATSGRLRFDATFPALLEAARITLRETVFRQLLEGKA
jgi:vacuolar-type H+-ATPase subunit E/Vma4